MLLKCCNFLKCLTVIKWLKKEEETNRKAWGENHIFFLLFFLKLFFIFFFLFLISHKLKKERREFYESLELDAEGPVGGGGHVRGRRSWDPRSLTLLTRAGGWQFILGRFQSPGIEVNTQARGKKNGCKRKLQEVTVHIVKLDIPEETRSDECRCQDKSIESFKEKSGGGQKINVNPGFTRDLYHCKIMQHYLFKS